MAEYTISVLLTSEDDATKTIEKFSGGLDDVSKSAEKLEESTEKTGSSLFSFENIVKGAGAALSVDLAKRAAEAIYELGELGAQSLRTKAAFDAISGGAGAASENLQAMQAATRGAMSDSDLMASANQLMQMGLASTSDELAKVTQMATRLGGAMGTDATASIENFSMMLANQSLPRLDTFGISSGKVRARIAELQQETAGLSRETAFMTAVMEQGEAAMSRLGDTAGDELLAFEQLEATVSNLKTTTAEKAAPAVSQFAGTLNLLLNWNNKLAEATEKNSEAALNTAESYEEYRARMEQIATAQGKVVNAEGQLVDQGHILNKTIIGLIAPIEKVTDANFALSEETWSVIKAEQDGIPIVDGWMASMRATTETTEESTAQLMSADDAMKLFTATMDDSNISAEGASWQQETLAESLGITATAEQQAQQDAQLLAEAYQAGTISAYEFRQRLEGVVQGTQAFTEAEREAINTEIAAADASRALAEAHDQAAQAAAGQAQETMSLAGSLKDATSTQIAQQMIGMLDPEKMGAEAYSSAVKDIGLSFGIMDEESIALSENMGTLATAIQDGVIPTERADEALSALMEDAKDGTVAVNDLIGEFSDVPQNAGNASVSVTGMGQATVETGTAIDTSMPKFGALNQEALNMEENFMNATQAVWGLIDAINSVPELDDNDDTDERASGGPVRAGQSYIVGEKRPELFVPATDGIILPSVPSSLGGGATGGAGAVIVMPVILQMEDYMSGGELDYRALAKAVVR